MSSNPLEEKLVPETLESQPKDDSEKPEQNAEPEKPMSRRERLIQEEIKKQEQSERDRLDREQKYTEISIKRGAEDWERWCEKHFVNEVKLDVQETQFDLMEWMDLHDYSMEWYADHRKHADEQYARNRVAHLKIVDYFISEFYRFF